MRKLLTGLALSAALAVGAVSSVAAPASAAGLSIHIGDHHRDHYRRHHGRYRHNGVYFNFFNAGRYYNERYRCYRHHHRTWCYR